ncbi:uncharacterized protein N7482_001381 [Penicillium canariense]|uniref:Major facilitator superfamily (MFS) profile domain-containing protein n=1 Tax=Penicillium canariense TaxID=189055 RepID=A0A9W9LTU7_9EURO|nr:uncharacterized protein N7482_001381 [Penicillium canariense]KAJ5175504.1 hypothetical protein N7482_001381 [Penicillium canariense]
MVGWTQPRGKSLSRAIGLVGAFGFVLQGYDQAVANGLLTLGSFITVCPQVDTVNTTGSQKSHNSTIQGTTVAIYEVGCALGALGCVFLGDLLGRRKTIFLAGCVALVGIAIQATHVHWVSSSQGLGVGGFTATIPIFVSESSGPEARGRMVLLEGWFAIGCIVHVTWLEFGLYYVSDNSVSWRFPIAFQGVFAMVVVLCIMFLPESPRWLARSGRFEEAAQVLARLEDVPVESEHVAQELEIIRHSLQSGERDESSGSGSPFALTKNRHLTPNARIITGCLQIWQFVAAGLAVLLIDRLPGRPLIRHPQYVRRRGITSLLFHGTVLLPHWVILGALHAAEIAPLRTRAKVTAMSAAANWLFNFLLAEVTPVGFARIQWRYYIVYACISAFACVNFYFFCPETKGRTLEEIDEIFVLSDSVFDTVRVAREMPFQTEILAHIDDTEKVGAEDERVDNVGATGAAAAS